MSDNPVATMRMAKAFAHLDPRKGLSGGIAGGFSSIGYRGKVLTLRHQGKIHHFTREDDGTPSAFLDVIIVGVNPTVSKAFYPEWDEDSSGGPVCTALMGVEHGPDPGVPEPQARSCAVCPRDHWKTLPSGRPGKECQDHKRLAVLLMPKITTRMLGAPLKEPVYFKIPPGSLTALKTHDDNLQHQGLAFASVITRISFDQQQLFRLTFKILQTLTDETAPFVLPHLESAQTNRILGMHPEIREVQEEVREVQKVAAAPAKEEEAEDTGLEGIYAIRDLKRAAAAPKAAPKAAPAAAAAPVAPRGRGRPRKDAASAPAPSKELDLFAVKDEENGKAQVHDDDDDEVSALLNQSISDILK